jgi:aldehyde:ferredoxin oxidoreductase
LSDIAQFGFFGKVLEVDLASGRIAPKKLEPETMADYVGGRGLATQLFWDEIEPTSDPLSSDNIIVVATSPLVGTKAPTSCRGHMVFKSPLTGKIGSSNCGGTWGNMFKATGFDAIVIKGKAPSPVMIDISPEKAEIIPAHHLWGLDVHQTTDRLIAGETPGKSTRVLCIGPAGENLVRFAAVMNDKNRAYGRAGPGAVWGSKKLKAIRVSGKSKAAIKDVELYRSGLDQSFYLLKQAPATKRILRDLGTSGLVELINIIDMLPHRNFQDTVHWDEDLDKISGETISRTILERPGACYGCPIGCQRHTRVGDKHGEGPEYETVVLIGPVCDIYNLDAITRANYLCNELGLDTISFGATVSCAMELFEQGIISLKDTDGLELRFGNDAIIEELALLIALRKGIGDKMAEGSLRFAAFFNRPQLSMSVKGMEFPAYDPRASFTQALGYMTSPTGACHLRGGYAVSLAFFGGAKEIPRFSLLQSPISIRNMQNLGILQDSLGVCRFTGYALSTEAWARMISGVTGLDFSTARLDEIANRIASLERLFNLEAGLRLEDDELPGRFQKEPILVSEEEKIVSEEAMAKMRSDYYEVRGWDKKGKIPESLLRDLKIARARK